MSVGVLVAIVSALVGLLIGALAGFYGGAVDDLHVCDGRFDFIAAITGNDRYCRH